MAKIVQVHLPDELAEWTRAKGSEEFSQSGFIARLVAAAHQAETGNVVPVKGSGRKVGGKRT